MDGYLTSFLRAHEQSIAEWSLTEDELNVTLKPGLERSAIVIFFADLITYVSPKVAWVNPRDNARIRLELDTDMR